MQHFVKWGISILSSNLPFLLCKTEAYTVSMNVNAYDNYNNNNVSMNWKASDVHI